MVRAIALKVGSALCALWLLAPPAHASAPDLDVQTKRAPLRANKLTIELEGKASDQVKVLSRQGSTLAPEAASVTPRAGDAARVEIPADRPVILRPAVKGQPKVLSAEPKESSGILIDSAPIPGASGDREIRQWTLVIRAQRAPLPWDAARKAYSTSVLIGLKERSGATSSRLRTPQVVRLTGINTIVEPARIELSEAGVAGFQQVSIALQDRREKAAIAALSDFGEESYIVQASPRLHAIDVEPGAESVPGFGIGTTELTVVRRAEDGLALLGPHALTISLRATAGQLHPGIVTFDASSSRSTKSVLRSTFLGEADIVASVDGIRAAPVKIRFTPPWSLLLAILLGAGLGAYVRVRSNGKNLRSPEFATGFGAGIILAFGSFVGIASVFTIPVAAVLTEIGCFVIAALEAYAGRMALDARIPVRKSMSAVHPTST